ncbi:hypothetical protein [Saccharopolyspora taberi]|uniref:PAS domain-containing protein n=1 Tax=Saccharopolyspora taberi TaxID=60895 RepID=A0ABN3VC02_9PSEU
MTERSERIRRASGVLDVDGTLGWDAEQLVLPAAPALLSDAEGVVIRATGQAVRLAGESSPAPLIGRKLTDLVVGEGALARLKGRDREVPVRPRSRTCSGTCSAGTTPQRASRCCSATSTTSSG